MEIQHQGSIGMIHYRPCIPVTSRFANHNQIAIIDSSQAQNDRLHQTYSNATFRVSSRYRRISYTLASNKVELHLLDRYDVF